MGRFDLINLIVGYNIPSDIANVLGYINSAVFSSKTIKYTVTLLSGKLKLLVRVKFNHFLLHSVKNPKASEKRPDKDQDISPGFTVK